MTRLRRLVCRVLGHRDETCDKDVWPGARLRRGHGWLYIDDVQTRSVPIVQYLRCRRCGR